MYILQRTEKTHTKGITFMSYCWSRNARQKTKGQQHRSDLQIPSLWLWAGRRESRNAPGRACTHQSQYPADSGYEGTCAADADTACSFPSLVSATCGVSSFLVGHIDFQQQAITAHRMCQSCYKMLSQLSESVVHRAERGNYMQRKNSTLAKSLTERHPVSQSFNYGRCQAKCFIF